MLVVEHYEFLVPYYEHYCTHILVSSTYFLSIHAHKNLYMHLSILDY